MDLRPYIESTILTPTVTGAPIDQLCREAKENQLLGVCVPPFWVRRAKRELAGSSVILVTVIGFPYGYQMTEVKMEEARLAVGEGADELDLVMNISAFKDGMNWPKIEVAKMATMLHAEGKLLKVIIECPLLDQLEMKEAALMCADAGADIVKTSTGTTGVAVDVPTIELLRSVLPKHVGIKASGGIKDRNQAIALVQAGADRLGTSRALMLL
jgi:deoxyribose-phosphate aldolase